jgi:hypothetical protein
VTKFVRNGPLILPKGIPKHKPMSRELLGEPPKKPLNWCSKCGKYFVGRLEVHLCPTCKVQVYHRPDKDTGIVVWRCGQCGQVVEPEVQKSDGVSYLCPQCKEELDDLIDAQKETRSGNLPPKMARATKTVTPVTRKGVRTPTFGEVTMPGKA